jgi:DNA-binding IclR family transcriptional regulator
MARGKTERLNASPKPAADRYSAPALEKGLDILEELSEQADGLTQKQIADRLGRSASEIFRMLTCLEQRGYVRRDLPAETYRLTPKLFELSHRHPPTRRLLDVALPIMRDLARRARQSCHLAVLYGQDVLVVAQVESPDVRNFSIHPGARIPALETGSGCVLLAWADPVMRDEFLAQAVPAAATRAAEQSRLESIRRRGFERHRSHSIRGVIDLSFPVCDHRGFAVAALTVPCLTLRSPDFSAAAIQEYLAAAAAELTRAIGGMKP